MQEREKLSSRLGFILLSAGCAIGLGNVWRFPYITGEYGGATFVLIYLIFLVLIGVPVMTMEFAIGRGGKQNIVGAYRTLEPKGSKWHIAGPFAIFGNYMLLFFYVPVTGWLIYYFYLNFTGHFANQSTEFVTNEFNVMLANPTLQFFWAMVALAITALVAVIGLAKGVERVSKFMMVILLALMVVLAVHSVTLPGSHEGLMFFIKPSLEKITDSGLGEVIFAAMGQAFFTLSLGIGAMTIMGSYFGEDKTLTGETPRIIILDTMVALLAGFIIFPACSAFGIEAGQGAGLMFVTLPNVFSQMTGGSLWGGIFFLAMSFAALTTLIAVFENLNSYWMDIHGFSRKNATLLNSAILAVMSLPCILGFNLIAGFQPLGAGTSILDLEDFIVSNLLLPLGSLVMVLFCSWRYGWGWDNFTSTADKGDGLKFPRWLRLYCRYILPLIILYVTIEGIVQKF